MLVLLVNELLASVLVLVSAGGITTILGSLLNGERELPGLLGGLFRVLGLQDADTLRVLFFMLGVLLLQICFESLSKYIVSLTSVSLTRELRTKLNLGLLKMDWLRFLELDQGKYTQALVVESGLAGGTLIHLGGVLANGIATLVLLTWMLIFSFETFAIFAIAGGFFLLVIQPVMRRTRSAAEKSILLSKEINNVTTDTRHLFKMLLAENLVRFRLRLTEDLISTSARIDLKKQIYGIINTQLLGLQALAILLIVTIFHLVVWGSSSTDLIVSLIILQRIGAYFTAFQNKRQLMLQLMPSYTTCLEFIATFDQLGGIESTQSEKPLKLSQDIELERVSFKHPNGVRGVEDVSLSLPSKGLAFFIGRSGSGKTTLVDIVSALIQPDSGQIRIDGIDLKQIPRSSLSQILSYVPQQAYLFKGTLRENLTLGNDAVSEQEIWEALEAADCANLIRLLPDQLDTQVSSGGANFSGGERHRLALARALLRKSRILILDEPAASLDKETERAIFKSLQKLGEGVLVIVITHSQESIQGMEHIYLIHEGKCIWQGTHFDFSQKEKLVNILTVGEDEE